MTEPDEEPTNDIEETAAFLRVIGNMFVSGYRVSEDVEKRLIFGSTLILAASVVQKEIEMCDAMAEFISRAYSGNVDLDDALSLLARHHVARYGSNPTNQ